jgi:long-chain acyl-CoA synthetase
MALMAFKKFSETSFMKSTDAYASLVDLLDQALKRHAGRVACVSMGSTLSYAELDRLATAWAGWLQSLNLPSGSRVAIMLPNVMASLVTLLGTLRAGHVVVNVNPLYTARELGLQLKDCQPSVLVVFESFAHTVQQLPDELAPAHVVVVSPGDVLPWAKRCLINWVVRHVKKRVPAWSLPKAVSFQKVLVQGQQVSFKPPALDLNDLAFLQYTGGTTGVPRGAMLSHGNVLANILQVEDVAEPALHDLLAQPLTMLTALPLYHVFAMTVCALYPLYAGMRIVLVINPRDFPALTALWKKESPHIFPAVNTLFAALLRHPAFRELDFSRMRISLGGGMAIHPSVAQQWQAVTGKTIVEGYGMSECSPVICANPTDAQSFSGSVGLPLAQTSVAILDDHQRPVPAGEIGEIAVRGPQVMRGYWNAPQASAAAFTSDGYLLTGDLGQIQDNGFVRIVDRKKDMVLVSGFNVYPTEIDVVFSAHPDVLDCAAIGVPDSECGEVVKLFVVPKHEGVDVTALKQWGAQNLTGYKRPREIVLVQSLPKNPVGKTLRRLLRDT